MAEVDKVINKLYDLIRELKYTGEKHKDDVVPTFGTNINIMCYDIIIYVECAIQTIRELQSKLDKRYEQDFEFDFSNCTSFNCQCGRHYINSSAKMQNKEEEVCEWKEYVPMDKAFHRYDLGCMDDSFQFTSNTNYKYCPYCGRKIKVVE